MPRLLLEGKSITELLARVRAEHGDEVTIVAAEKVRSGGIGGFFAKESYSLTVEVDADAEAPAAVDPGPGPLGMDALLTKTRGRNRTPDGPAGIHAPVRDVEAPGSLLDLAAAIDEAEAAENSVILATRPMHAAVQSPMLSTASPEFAAILARLNALDAPLADETAAVETPTGAGKDAYARLREALVEIAPHLDLNTSVPLVLVIPPAVLHPAVPVVPVEEAPAGAAPVLPRQGRHRRAAMAQEA